MNPSWAALAGVVVVACGGGREARAPERVTTTSAALVAAPATPSRAAPAPPPRVTSASAVARITGARCDREATCHGSSVDRDGCMNRIGHDVAGELPTEECPFVDPARLASCVDSVRGRVCGDDGLDVTPACAREQLCVRE